MAKNSSSNKNQEKQLPNYTIEGLLGKGGLGEVFKVRDEAFDRELALKTSIRGKKKDIARFVGEARLTGQLQHPVIPPVYSLGQDDKGKWYYTMKRIRGNTLGDLLRALQNNDPQAMEQWSLRRLLTMFIQVCQAVAYAHSRGVIHRDIKPSNIMLGDYGEVYLLDWGLAKAFGKNLYTDDDFENQPGFPDAAYADMPTYVPDAETIQQNTGIEQTIIDRTVVEDTHIMSTLAGENVAQNEASTTAWETASDDEGPIKPWSMDESNQATDTGQMDGTERTISGDILGTPMYMAPEQAAGTPDQHDHRTDLYSLGVVLWEIITGERMRLKYKGNIKKLIKASVFGDRPDLDEISRRKRVVPELQEILLKLTSPLMDERYQTANSIADDIQHWLDGKRTWKKVFEVNFTEYPDMEIRKLSENEAVNEDIPATHKLLKPYCGQWAIDNGCLTLREGADSIVHINQPFSGSVCIEMMGSIEQGSNGELSILLNAPILPIRRIFDDGYCFQFGADNMQHSKLVRDGHDIAISNELSIETGHDYLIRAESCDGILAMWVDGEPIIRQREFFPLEGTRCGVYGFGTGMRIKCIRVYSAGVARQVSCLAVPDKLASLKLWDAALAEYERINESHEGNEEGDLAAFKAGLCYVEKAKLAIHDKNDPTVWLNHARKKFTSLDSTPILPLGVLGQLKIADIEEAPLALYKKLYIKGLENSQSEQLEGLNELLIEILKQIPRFGAAGHILSSLEIFEMLGKHLKIHRAIKADIYIKSTNILVALGRYDQAITVIERVFNEFEDNKKQYYKALELQAQILAKNGQLSNGLKKLESACIMAKGTIWYLHLKRILSHIYLAHGKHQTALDVLQGLHSEKSEYYKGMQLKRLEGQVLMQTGKYDEAETIMQEQLNDPNEMDINKAAALLNLGEIYIRRGDMPKGNKIWLGILEDYSQLAPYCSHALLLSGMALLQDEKFDEAEKLFFKNTQDYPYVRHGRESIIWLALLEFRKNNKYQALEYLKSFPFLEECNFNFNQIGWMQLFWLALVFQGDPVNKKWLTDEQGIEIDPPEVRRRELQGLAMQRHFNQMIEFCASFNPAWSEWIGKE